jgi:hypothetical protein
MSAISSWDKQLSVWAEFESQREKMKGFRQEYEASMEEVDARLGAALSSNITAGGNLAAEAALKRVREQTTAKLKANQDAASLAEIPIYQNKTPPSYVKVGDSSIDLSSNTLTLKDGTQIDIKTGVKIDKKV